MVDDDGKIYSKAEIQQKLGQCMNHSQFAAFLALPYAHFKYRFEGDPNGRGTFTLEPVEESKMETPL
jgi:hypothetical protein